MVEISYFAGYAVIAFCASILINIVREVRTRYLARFVTQVVDQIVPYRYRVKPYEAEELQICVESSENYTKVCSDEIRIGTLNRRPLR